MKTKTSAALLLTLTFALGGLAGAVSHSLYQSRVNAAARPGRPSMGPHEITDNLARSLKLDVAQKEELSVIIRESRERYRALSVQFRPQYEGIRAETRQRIRGILREDQKASFEEFIREEDLRHRARSQRGSR